MNRKQKRSFMKVASKRNISKDLAEAYMRLQERGFDGDKISDGDLVKLNVKMIQSHPDYKRLTDAYRAFVESNCDTVFTAKVENTGFSNGLVSFQEVDTGWCFWPGDLILVK